MHFWSLQVILKLIQSISICFSSDILKFPKFISLGQNRSPSQDCWGYVKVDTITHIVWRGMSRTERLWPPPGQYGSNRLNLLLQFLVDSLLIFPTRDHSWEIPDNCLIRQECGHRDRVTGWSWRRAVDNYCRCVQGRALPGSGAMPCKTAILPSSSFFLSVTGQQYSLSSWESFIFSSLLLLFEYNGILEMKVQKAASSNFSICGNFVRNWTQRFKQFPWWGNNSVIQLAECLVFYTSWLFIFVFDS